MFFLHLFQIFSFGRSALLKLTGTCGSCDVNMIPLFLYLSEAQKFSVLVAVSWQRWIVLVANQFTEIQLLLTSLKRLPVHVLDVCKVTNDLSGNTVANPQEQLYWEIDFGASHLVFFLMACMFYSFHSATFWMQRSLISPADEQNPLQNIFWEDTKSLLLLDVFCSLKSLTTLWKTFAHFFI